MRKSLALALIALVTLAIGVSAQATPQQSTAALQRRIVWQNQHIRQLNHRRAYLHRYIRHLRATTTPIVHHTTPAPTASTTTTSTTSYSGGVLSASQVAAYARAAGFPESAIPTMVAYAYRESRFNPRAINGSSGACGLWQIYVCPGSQALNPATNAALAFQKYQASGFAPWGG